MKKIILSIDGMTCSACSNGLEKYLNKQNGIRKATVNLVMNTANIEYDESKLKIEDLEKFVEKAGFKSLGIDDLEKKKIKEKNEKYKLGCIVLIALLILYISMSHIIGLPQIRIINMDVFPLNFAITLFILSFFVLILGNDILKSGIKNLLHKTPNMDTLVTIGALSSFLYSIYGTIMIFKGNTEYVGNLYYESAAIVIAFIKIGKYIESKNKNKAKEALKELMSITPKNAIIERNNKEITVTIDEIKKDDIVICKPGQKIAVDGTVIEGNTHIDNSFITGESIPIKINRGSKVIAGSINYEGMIKYKAEKIGKESTVSEIVRMVLEATNTKAPIAKIADKISSYFVPIILLLAILSFVIWLIISHDISFSLNIFVSILVIACPCSLGLATPLAIVISSGLCSKNGILVKTSEVLENAHKVKTIVFDKTGTLTRGELTISSILKYIDIDDETLIQEVASIEKKSEHPIGKAIVEKAKRMNIQLLPVEGFQSFTGFGVYGKIENNEYYIGNRSLMTNNSIKIKNIENEESLAKEGNSVLYIAKNGQLVSLIGVKDTIKEEAKTLIKDLKNSNVNVIMLTGDNKNTADVIAKEIGIDYVVANVKPKEKAEKIKELKKKGLTMMCGDGVNDSVSLVTADIGVSISNGTDIAIDSAQVVLMNDDLNKINDLIYISKKTIRNIKQNLFWAFFYNICMIPIALGLLKNMGILLNPMIASFAMTISSITVVLNALRLRKIMNYKKKRDKYEN